MNILDILDGFNVICRLDGLAGRVRKGGGRHFEIDRRCGMTGAEIERYLRRYAVRVFGRGFGDGTLYFSVGPKQARWAEYLLHRHGLPVVSASMDPQQAARAQALHRRGAPLPRPWSSGTLPTEALQEWRDAGRHTEIEKRGPDRDRGRRKGKPGDAPEKILGLLDRF